MNFLFSSLLDQNWFRAHRYFPLTHLNIKYPEKAFTAKLVILHLGLVDRHFLGFELKSFYCNYNYNKLYIFVNKFPRFI